MEAGKQNIIINKKASFEFDFFILEAYNPALPPDDDGQTPVDLTGCTISAKSKRKITDPTNLFSFTSSIVDPEKGHCRLSLSAAQTSAMTWDTGVWDVFVTFPDGKVVKYLEGNMVLDKSAT